MTPIKSQYESLKKLHSSAQLIEMGSGGHMIEIPEFQLPPGWNRERATLIFVAPPGFPGAQPDCFWLEPAPIRLAGGQTPKASNDSNPIPGVGPRGTWFSWHLQSWNPNRDTLLTFLEVIEQRLRCLE